MKSTLTNSAFFVTFFGSQKRIAQFCTQNGFNFSQTRRVVWSARIWAFFALLFAIPYFFWFCLAAKVFWHWNMPFVNQTGDLWLGTLHFQWLWWNMDGDTAYKTSILLAFPMQILLGLEWITYNLFIRKKSFNRGYRNDLRFEEHTPAEYN